jgi:hypothetical protein
MSSMEIQYKPLTPDLVEALVECVLAVYGEHYSLPEFYDVQKIRDLLQRGLLYAFVGLNSRGEIVGTLGAQLECANAVTIDGRTGMVRSEYRQHGVLQHLGMLMFDIYQQLQIRGIQMYAVTFHTISQKHGLTHGCYVTGLLPAHFPCVMVPAEYHAFAGRVGAVSMYYSVPTQPLPPLAVCLPAQYCDVIGGLYAAKAIARSEIPPARHIGGDQTCFNSVFNARTFATTALIETVGRNFAATLDDIFAEAMRHCSAVVYLDVPLASPDSSMAVDLANQQGFFYGALLPARKAGDILRLQKLADPDSIIPGEMKLYSDEVQRMLDFVLADARRCARG